MKKYFRILLSVSIILIATIQTQGQAQKDLPMACTGSVERYGVGHVLDGSFFTWTITDEHGTVVPYTRVNGSGDTIQINWNESLTGGIYTFEVLEHSSYVGCGDGEPYRDSIMLNSPTINIPFDLVKTSFEFCKGDQAALDPGLFQSYLWQDKTTNRIYYTGVAGTYQVRLTDENQSCSFDTLQAKMYPLPHVWLGNDTVLFGNQTLTLDVYNSDINFYDWSTKDISSSITVSGQAGNQSIWVMVTDVNGCKNSDTINISAADYNNLRIPAAFTPNGDGINDKWYFPAPPLGSTINQDLYPYFDEIEVRVFNRWGRLVWESHNNFIAWDGKDLKGEPLPMDSYHYIIRFKVNDKTYLYKGSITIVR